MLFANFMRRSGANSSPVWSSCSTGHSRHKPRIRPSRSTVLYCSRPNLGQAPGVKWLARGLGINCSSGRSRHHCSPGSRARPNSKRITDAVISAADFHSPALPNPREPISNEAQRQPCVECVDALAPTGSTNNYYMSNDLNSGVLRFLPMPG